MIETSTRCIERNHITAPTPINRPNQRVHRRMSSVAAPPNVADVDISNRVSPNMLPSAVPNPPGRPEAEPINEDTARINVALIKRSIPPVTPRPVQTKYKATHSPDHDLTPIQIASNNGR